ncbi:acyl-CoA dehydrogenase family protein [Catelliglobosispora koreensis]|uniref:acyl-CoA dehydrogenase family protein n=1 Tax=Catelliglobosispora koreensis TaxID=129052 RepID=UPI00036956EE|nr:acyl-CoA dehydrogenase family protein [Catelliglobosispora koreensis]
MGATHEVLNQPPALIGYDAFAADNALASGVDRYGAEAFDGSFFGSEQAQELARLAHSYPPVLRTHDRFGNRIDEVEFHPAWHELMRRAVEAGAAGAPWAAGGSHVKRAALAYLGAQVEAGHGCPISMTYAILPALRHEPSLASLYEAKLASRTYDFGLRPPLEKDGLIAGMAMTEKQGGSDVRANTTRAVPTGDHYLLTGHKWFCSAPMSDVFLVLAQAPGGLTCFLLPRVLPDGTRNTFRLQRLKDKLGNRSNASSEVEFDDTVAWRAGPEGRGVATIIEMVQMTRLDCVIGSAGLMRAALVQAIHHARHRRAFGELLVDQPAMTSVLADLAVESEAATALMLRLANAVDTGEVAFGRLATAVGKFWVCKRGPMVAAEALECLGGNGYVEDSGLPRLYREAPLNSIWEGSGNVIALDTLRAMAKQPESVSAFFAELALSEGADARLDAAVKRLQTLLLTADQSSARRITALMAVCLQGSLLVRQAPADIADAFCATRLEGDWSGVFGTLPPGTPASAITDRAFGAR